MSEPADQDDRDSEAPIAPKQALKVRSKPPRVPIARRLRRVVARGWPVLVWTGAAIGAGLLYRSEGVTGQALAYSEMIHYDLTPEVSGKLSTVRLEVGQKVEVGEILGVLESSDVDERIAAAKSGIERLEARVKARRKRSPKETSDDHDTAVKAALCGASPDRVLLEMDTLTTSQAADQAEIDTLATQLAHLEPLLDQHLVTADRLDEMRMRRNTVSMRISGRGQELHRLGDCLDLSAEVELKIQEMALSRLEHERLRYSVMSPVKGTVEAIAHRPGEWVAAGTPIAEIVEARPNHVVAYITDRQVDAIRVGTKTTVTPRDRSGSPLHGKVTTMGARIEQVPLRLRFIPTIAQWGRLVTIDVEAPGVALPGEIYNASFEK